MNSEESSKMLSITPPPPITPELASVCQWSCTFSTQHIMQPPLTDMSKTIPTKANREQRGDVHYLLSFCGRRERAGKAAQRPSGDPFIRCLSGSSALLFMRVKPYL